MTKKKTGKYLASIDDLNLSTRVSNCLKKLKIYSIAELQNWNKYELMKTPDLGKRSLQEIESALAAHGLCLGVKDEAQIKVKDKIQYNIICKDKIIEKEKIKYIEKEEVLPSLSKCKLCGSHGDLDVEKQHIYFTWYIRCPKCKTEIVEHAKHPNIYAAIIAVVKKWNALGSHLVSEVKDDDK